LNFSSTDIQAGASHVIVSGFMFDMKENDKVATFNFDKLSQLVSIVGKDKVSQISHLSQ
jgi:hypothetical protein